MMWFYFPSGPEHEWSVRVRVLLASDESSFISPGQKIVDPDCAVQAAVQLNIRSSVIPNGFEAGCVCRFSERRAWRAWVVVKDYGSLRPTPGLHAAPSSALEAWALGEGGSALPPGAGAWLDSVLADPDSLIVSMSVMES